MNKDPSSAPVLLSAFHLAGLLFSPSRRVRVGQIVELERPYMLVLPFAPNNTSSLGVDRGGHVDSASPVDFRKLLLGLGANNQVADRNSTRTRLLREIRDIGEANPREALLMALSLRAAPDPVKGGSRTTTAVDPKKVRSTEPPDPSDPSDSTDDSLSGALAGVEGIRNFVDNLFSGDFDFSNALKGLDQNFGKRVSSALSAIEQALRQKLSSGVGGLEGGDIPSVDEITKLISLGGERKTAKPEKLLPDLIYMGGDKKNEISLLSLLGAGDEDPIKTLQTLIGKIQVLAESKQDGAASGDGSTAQTFDRFFLARLDGDHTAASSAPFIVPNAAELPPGVSTLDAVRQAQTAMADMAERLQGRVALDSENMRAMLHLEPPSLGRLQIRMEIDAANRLTAHISADQDATREFLRQNQSDLRQGLAQQGFDPDKIEIVFDEDKSEVFRGWLEESPYGVRTRIS